MQLYFRYSSTLGDLGPFGGQGFLRGGALQHAFAVRHDPRQLGRVDTVAFDPGPDREQVRVADRALLAHDPRALQQLALDQLEAFRHRYGYLARHRLDRRGVVRPPRAPPAMRVRDVHGRAKIAVELLH